MTAELPPGTVLLDKYRIDRVLGKGGMGVVLAATHLQLNERVAMKFLLPEVLSNREIVTRFMREAQAAVRLKGEHVARVIDVGTLPWGAPYMVMEFLEGMDLAALIEHRGTIPSHEAVDYLLQACEALAEAHSLRIIHRDIKPANFFITRRPDGTPLLKVLDFGISKAPVAVDVGLTSTQAVMGTPSYMSPEQMRSVRDVDERTDIWALGVVLYEALGGRRPFEADTFSALCIKAAMDPTPPLTVGVPAGLDSIVYRCLEKDQALRFSSVAELAVALAPYAGNQRQASIVCERASAILGVKAHTRGFAAASYGSAQRGGEPVSHTRAAAAAAPTTLGASAGSLSTGPRPSRRSTWIGGGLITIAGAAVATVLLVRNGGRPTDQYQARPAAGGQVLAPGGAGSAALPLPPTDQVAPPDVKPDIKPAPDVSAPKVSAPKVPAPEKGAVVSSPAPEKVVPKLGKAKADRRKSNAGDKKATDTPREDKAPASNVAKPDEIKNPPRPLDPLNSRT